MAEGSGGWPLGTPTSPRTTTDFAKSPFADVRKGYIAATLRGVAMRYPCQPSGCRDAPPWVTTIQDML